MPVKRTQHRQPLGQILVQQNLITEEQVQEALAIQKERGGLIGAILIELGYITEEQRNAALAEQAGMEFIDLDKMEIPPDVISRVSVSIAEVYKIVPIRFENNTLTVVLADPMNINALDDLRFMLACDVKGAVASPAAIDRAIEKYYAGQKESVDQLIEELEQSSPGLKVDYQSSSHSQSIDLDQLEELAHSMPVVRLLNLILLQAIKDRASDIHFEPFEDEFKVRYRVDGALYEMMPPPRHLALALTSRIKVMANLDIAETRMPQDGRIELSIAGNPIELRVSTLPTVHGESIVLRVLDRSVVGLDIDRIGLREDDLETIRSLIKKPNGILLCTGPTGSGKTTTLYACLNAINDVGITILTAEDPVEYELDGIIQIPVNEEIGVTFARILRSFLRHDPNKILVGEVRDLETAQIAIQASLTGHLVFSTLHTNDAPSTITRLVDMGVEPFMICATLEAIIAQRLVRTICVECKEAYEPTPEALATLNLTPEEVQGRKFFYGKGCPNCNNTGYKGRTALFEIMLMTDQIRELVMQNASHMAIREKAREQGMRTLRESGLLKIYDGWTTIEEVSREVAVD